MIVETEDEFRILQQAIKSGPSFWIPTFSDTFRHYTENSISFVYIYSLAYEQEFLISFSHNDCISLQRERLLDLTSDHDIFVLGKKRFRYFYPYSCIDADLIAWWQTHKMLPLDESNTEAHDAWNRWWHDETNTNNWLPIMRHIERCTAMREKFMSFYSKFEKTPEFCAYEHDVIKNLSVIEQAGIQVNKAKFNKHFNQHKIDADRVFTEYNIYTITGRPSNKFNGVNYAALNKEDGSRSAFISRHDRGILLELDFDAYHVRLIADLIKYQLPSTSVHDYFGRQYFGKDELTDQEYEESKQITFRLLYGGIDDDFAKIPYFGQVRNYIRKIWQDFKTTKVVHTPIYRRPMFAEHLPDMNANKLFNYILQSTETERNLHVLTNVLEYLQTHKSYVVLYTYDSILIDFDLSDGGKVINELIGIISDKNQYPVKIKAGLSYDSMKLMNR